MRQSKTNEIQTMLNNLHSLKEQNDQSRQQTCQLFFSNDAEENRPISFNNISDQNYAQNAGSIYQSNHNLSIKQSSIDSSMSKTSINQQNRDSVQSYGNLGDYCRKSAQSKWQSNHHGSEIKNQSTVHRDSHHKKEETMSVIQVRKLKEINNKLFQDNKTLLGECIRLRKIITINEYQNMEHQKVRMISHINKLRCQNVKLKTQLSSFQGCNKLREESQIMQIIASIQEDNRKLGLRIQQIQNGIKNPNNLAMKNSTGFTFSTEESKSQENQLGKDMIQSVISKRKSQKDLTDYELNSQSNGSFLSTKRSNMSPRAKVPIYKPFRQIQH